MAYENLDLDIDFVQAVLIAGEYVILFMLYLKGFRNFYLFFSVYLVLSFLITYFTHNSANFLASIIISTAAFSQKTTHGFILLAVIYMAVIYLIWYLYGKDPPIGAITVQYNPSQELDPLTMSYLIFERTGPKDIFSAILNLVNKDYIGIEMQKGDFYLHNKVKDINDESLNMTSPERFLMNRIFMLTGMELIEKGVKLDYTEFPKVVSLKYVLSDVVNWFKAFENNLEQYLVQQNYYEFSPVYQKKVFRYLGIFFVVVSLLFIRPCFLLTHALSNYILPLIFMGIASFIAGKYITKRTKKGVEAYKNSLGYMEFVKRVEEPRLKYLIREEKANAHAFLIYALALGMIGKIRMLKIVLSGLYSEMPSGTKQLFALYEFIEREWRNSARKKHMKQTGGSIDIMKWDVPWWGAI